MSDNRWTEQVTADGAQLDLSTSSSGQKQNSASVTFLTPPALPHLHLPVQLSGTLSLPVSHCLATSLAPSLGAEVNHALRPCSLCVSSATSVWGLCVPLISRGAMLSPECVSVCVCLCPLPSLRSRTGRPAWEVSAAPSLHPLFFLSLPLAVHHSLPPGSTCFLSDLKLHD